MDWAWYVAGGVVVLALIGVLAGLMWERRAGDNGLMVKDGNALRWLKVDLPLPVFFDEDLDDKWLVRWGLAVAEIRKVIGRDAFMPATMAVIEGATLGGVLLSDGEGNPSTELSWDKRSGVILRAHVSLPTALSDHEAAGVIVLHEALHALGFDHDKDRASVMHPSIQDRSQSLTASDAALLKATYGALG